MKENQSRYFLVSPYMYKIINSANLKGRVVLDGNLTSEFANADGLIYCGLTLFGSSEHELQDSLSGLWASGTNFGMIISGNKTQIMHVRWAPTRGAGGVVTVFHSGAVNGRFLTIQPK